MSLGKVLDNLKQHEVFLAGKGVAGVIVRHDLAYHFYTEDCPRLIDDLHSHKRSYTSYIEYGEVRNHIYEIKGTNRFGGKFLMNIDCELLCGKGGCAPHQIAQCNLNVEKIDEITTKQGESYSLTYDQFHKFELVSSGPVVTRMTYSKIMQPNTQIIVDRDYVMTKCCPPTASENELWDMIESCLAPAWENAESSSTLKYELIDGKVFG